MLSAAVRVRRIITEWQPDIVHCHNPAMAMTVALARTLRPVPAIVTVHGLVREEYAPAARWLRRIDMPVVSCSAGVSAVLARHRVSSVTIPNGVTPPPAPASRADVDRLWPALRGRRLILVAGRLIHWKNFPLALRALRLIPDASLLIVGDGPMLGALTRLATDAGLAEHVVFAGFRTDVRELMGAADVIMITSSEEGLPLVGLEAFAAGRPLVAVRGIWQMDLVRGGEDCLLVEPDDDIEMAAAVRRLLDDQGLAGRLATNGLALAARHTDAVPADAYIMLYERVIADARAR
jgi:glycosyltransferase involved in cell wall biosynthesis